MCFNFCIYFNKVIILILSLFQKINFNDFLYSRLIFINNIRTDCQRTFSIMVS